MGEKKITGIYFYNPNGLSDSVDFSEVSSHMTKNPDVSVIWNQQDIPLTDHNKAVSKIKEKNLKRIIIAGNMPGMVKSYFTKVMVAAGNNPEDVILASFRENNALTKRDTERAKAIVTCAVYDIPFEIAASPGESAVNNETLVIGAGIAGIQASLEIANAGYKVHLLERTGTIGGHMATFDKTFPTLDCAACILTPKMVEIGQHSNINLMTFCEVKNVQGEPGNYKVKILKRTRRVNEATCIGCGICTEKCPALAPSEFDAQTCMRKAIYIPFPQAVPNKYLVDPDACTYLKNGKCRVCEKVCPVPDCINLDDKDQEIEINVGNIIIATGFKVFDAKRDDRFGYGKFPNVVTSLEFERLVNAAGPTSGNITFRSKDKKGNAVFLNSGKAPESVALIHCIGSRDENYNKYCSKVCCMYSLKLAHLIKEKLPDTDVFEYYIDMRAFGKGYEEFYERIKNEGINVVRGKTAKIDEKDGKLLIKTEDIHSLKLTEQKVDMVVLSVGLEPHPSSEEIGKMLGIDQAADGWFVESNYLSDPVSTYTGGISIAGVCQGPKDIPDTVAQASAAASRVIQSILKKKINKSIKDISLQEIEKKAKEISTTI
ncbi:MAG: CoB--CoM heterodisulfide reductase iron-sulfur subunit A family protein [Bacteroidota bacterium]